MKENKIETVKVYDRNNADYLGTCLMTRWAEYERIAGDREGFVVASDWLDAAELALLNCRDDAVVYFERITLGSQG